MMKNMAIKKHMQFTKVLMLVATLVILCCSDVSYAGRLHPQWCSFISQLCHQYHENPVCQEICHNEYATSKPFLHLLPHIILWDPLNQLKNFFPVGFYCPKCDETDSLLQTVGKWMDGVSSERTEPRKIHGYKGIVILVGRVYKCSSLGHEVLSYHPGILKHINTPSLVPFKLWSRTGFTNELVHYIEEMLISGVSASMIQCNLVRSNIHEYAVKRERYYRLKQLQHSQTPLNEDSNEKDSISEFPSYEHFCSFLPSASPSRHSVVGCFLAAFQEKQKLFEKHMQCTSITESDPWLSCDHTFASAANIGMSRDFDNRWITQFSALFCVMNGDGQIVTWKLTKGMTFADVECQLIFLRDRLTKQGKTLTEFYIDNCCSWRKKLQQVFGNAVDVKLDVFHAVKRITDKIPKRHPLRMDCIKDLRNVFRDPIDKGEKRLMNIPPPDVLLSQFDSFLQKWCNVEYNGWRTLSVQCLKEAQNLKQHMEKGCLSGIKPGRGTNRNEALHKKLNKVVASSRYGLELAYALFTILFFQHNEKILAKQEQRREKDILEYHFTENTDQSEESFGIRWLLNEQSDGNNIASDKSTLSLDQSSYSDFVTRINGEKTNLPTFRTVLCTDDNNDDDDHNQDSQTLFGDDINIPFAALRLILLKALSWYFVHQNMCKQTKKAKIPLKELPFMNTSLPKLLNSGELEKIVFNDSHLIESTNVHCQDLDQHNIRLENVLRSWNFKRISIVGDGNCLFHAVAHAVCSNSSSKRNLCAKLSLPPSVNDRQLSMSLRQEVVREWLGENTLQYQSFLTYNQLSSEAHKFLLDGHYWGDLGDLVLPALVNILAQPITIFTSAPNMPVVTLTPISSAVVDPNSLFLAYNQSGSGHYDSTVPIHTLDKENVQPESDTAVQECIKCTCGRNSKSGVSCIYSLYHYSTKCPCFKAGLPCNINCRCKGCKNPKGERPLSHPKTGNKRKRDVYDTQTCPLQGRKTSRIMEQVSASTTIGSVSKFEYLIISAIVQHTYSDIEDWNDVDNVDPQVSFNYFENIYKVIKLLNIQVPIFKRSLAEVETVLKHYKYQFDVFYKLHT